MKEHPYPDPMRHELLKGYCAGVTFMDSQLGKVLDTLKSTGLEESTVVVFFSDHGFSLGERGAWGKRSLFESDARVPLIFADPRYPGGHGKRTPALAELVDVFPTLTELAGLAPPHALVPPLSGTSLASVVRAGGARVPGFVPDLSRAAAGGAERYASGASDGSGGGRGSAEELPPPPRTASLSQFSRCPITASEFLTDISGFGPMVNEPGKVKDFRGRRHHGAIAWECTWKGWEWGEHHDLSVMGYSLRVDGWRYTAWLPWDFNATLGVWTYPPLGEELYRHEHDPNEPPGMFDELETVNLLAVDPLGEDGRPKSPGEPLLAVSAEARAMGKKLFEQLRATVIERRGVADEKYYLCDRLGSRHAREQCQKEVMAAAGVDASMKAQLASTSDSRDAQRSSALADLLSAPAPTLPLPSSPSGAASGTALSVAGGGGLPPGLAKNLARLRLVPDVSLQRLHEAVAVLERVAVRKARGTVRARDSNLNRLDARFMRCTCQDPRCAWACEVYRCFPS